MSESRTAVVGFGCAGFHGVKAMRDHGYRGTIDVYTDSEWAPGNPMLTTYYIYGKLPEQATMPFGTLKELSARYGFNVIVSPVKKVLSGTKEILLEDSTARQYDQILIASGASAFLPPVPGLDRNHVYAMRTIRDALALKPVLDRGEIRRAVVVGASMVGIKLIELLHARGIKCTLADMAPCIFPVSAVPCVSAEVERRLEAAGVDLAFSRTLNGVEEENGELQVALGDGERIPCDAVLMCIGTRANTAVADDGIQTVRGIVADMGMRTSAPGIYCAGDCCEGNNLQSGQNQIIGIWDNAAKQGTTAGINMAGGQALYRGNILHNITHFMGMDFIGYGDVRAPGTDHIYEDRKKGRMYTVRMKDGIPVCINLLDSYGASGVFKSYMVQKLEGKAGGLCPVARVRMIKEGIPEKLIELLTGEWEDANGKSN